MILTHFTVSLAVKCSLLIFDAFPKCLSLIVWVWRQRWQWRRTVVLWRWMDSNRLLTLLNLLSIKWQGKPHQEVKLTIWGELFIQFFKTAKLFSVFFMALFHGWCLHSKENPVTSNIDFESPTSIWTHNLIMRYQWLCPWLPNLFTNSTTHIFFKVLYWRTNKGRHICKSWF